MTKSAHTPGPWENDGLKITNQRGCIAIIPTPLRGGVMDCMNNARLIAAAPDLLEACHLALSRLKPGNIRTDFEGHILRAALVKAIARATGKEAEK